MAAKYHLKKTLSGQFMFTLHAGNGEIILTSESYQAKGSAQGSIESVRQNSPHDARYERQTSKDGKPFFELKAANGESIGRSETYSSSSAMENGIESVKKNGPVAAVQDDA